jgi:uncharacterized protein with HEPN domain
MPKTIGEGRSFMSHAALRIIEDIDQTPRTVIETTKDEFFSKRLNYDAITTRRDRVTALGRRSEPSETGPSHNYFSIDSNIIWKYVNDELPNIEEDIRSILAKRFDTGTSRAH